MAEPVVIGRLFPVFDAFTSPTRPAGAALGRGRLGAGEIVLTRLVLAKAKVDGCVDCCAPFDPVG